VIIDISPLTFVATIAIALLGPALTLMFDVWCGRTGGASLRAAFAVFSAGSASSLVALALLRPDLNPLLPLPLAALAGLASIIAAAPVRLLGFGAAAAVAFAWLWSLIVFTPVAIALFGAEGILGSALGTLDLAGALPVLVAAGAAGLAVLLISPGRPSARAPARPLVLSAAFAAVWMLWILWLVGLELALDDVTGRIILNAVVAPLASAITWLMVQRIRNAQTTVAAAVGGLLCGLVAITPGCGYLDPFGAAMTGSIAGAVCAVAVYALLGHARHPAWLLVTVLIVAASIGVGLLGAFSTRSGLVFTGQPEVLLSQFASAAVVTGYALVVSAPLWLLVRGSLSRRAVPVVPGSEPSAH
jgi:ammonia channel protein AmtB